MKPIVGRPVLFGFVSTFAILIVLAVFSFSSMNRLITTSRLLTHGITVISIADLALKSMVDLESAQRGYVITGQEVFLSGLDEKTTALKKQMLRLDSITSPDTLQHARVDTLHALVGHQLVWVNRVIDARKVGFEEARQLVATGEGRLYVDTIKAVVGRIQTEERASFRRQNTITGSSLKEFQYSFVGLSLAIIIIILVLFYTVNRVMNSRAKVERHIKQLNEGLESKVKDRTKELEDGQEKLNELNSTLEQRVEDRTAQLNRVNQELESFTYSVSHDLRAPLRSISGFSHILNEEVDKLSDEGKMALDAIARNSTRMGQLIDDLLDFSRVGRRELARQTVNMDELVGEVLRELVPVNDKIELQLSSLPAAKADPSMIRQVWTNLISNALKYSRNKEKIHIEIGSYREGDKHYYFIKDNGAGFDMHFAGKLFGVFQRLHKAKEFEGTGVGLALVKTIIVRHGGDVGAEARLNEGARFFFTLPANGIS